MDRKSRIIAVANEKGGVGKTVTVVNLGAALSRMGKNVLIVDMDPQFNATKGLGVEVTEGMPTTYDLMHASALSSVDAIVRTRWEGLDIIPAHVDLAGAEVELMDAEGRENRLKNALADMNGRYDFILLDTPPSLSLLTVNVFACAEEVIVPCQTQPYAYEALVDLFDTVSAIQEDINPALKVTGILATFYDQRTRISQKIMTQLQETAPYKDLLFNTVIRSNITIAESADVRKPVVFYRPACIGSLDYAAFAEELVERRPGKR
jgi:chromosome partitioning protein